MEKINESVLENREKFGKNVEIHAIFVRHGEKDKTGQLSEEGKRQAVEFGSLLEKKTAVKGYSSPVKRVLETVDTIVESAPGDKKLVTRARVDLTYPTFSKKFMEEFGNIMKEKGQDAAVEWWFNLGNERFDAESPTTKEVAESGAYILNRYIEMSKKLYSGSKIDLVNGTHQGLPEALLQEIMVRKEGDKEVTGFDTLDEIGGSLQPTESVEYVIKTNSDGDKSVFIQFRGNTYGIDLEKFNLLVERYKERRKKEEER